MVLSSKRVHFNWTGKVRRGRLKADAKCFSMADAGRNWRGCSFDVLEGVLFRGLIISLVIMVLVR